MEKMKENMPDHAKLLKITGWWRCVIFVRSSTSTGVTIAIEKAAIPKQIGASFASLSFLLASDFIRRRTSPTLGQGASKVLTQDIV